MTFAGTFAHDGFGTAESTFVVELDQFNGPFDLLLALIREEQVELVDIPVARIAEQFLARIGTLGLGSAAEYLDLAARLVRIKAQMLLPRREGDDEWDDPRTELVRRLLEYQQIREIVDVLEHRGESRRNRFARGYLPPERVAEPAPATLSLGELLAAVDRVMRLVSRPDVHDVVPRALDVDGAIALVRAVLAARSRARWGDVVRRGAEPWEILSALLALLELARRGEVRLRQPEPFSTLHISRDAAGEAA